jgi:hypothetical protein
VRRFCKKKFSLQSETWRNEIRFVCVSHIHAKNKKYLFFASFRFEFVASDQSEINRAYFRFVSLSKICRFASFSFCFRFISFRFTSDAKTSEKNTFPIEEKKFRFRFASFRFQAKIMAVFRFRFASFNFEAKMMPVFRFRFASFRFEAKIMAVFRFFFVLSSLRSIFVSLQISMFRINAKRAKKGFFFASKRNKFRFRFASFRFEAKMTAHPSYNYIH